MKNCIETFQIGNKVHDINKCSKRLRDSWILLKKIQSEYIKQYDVVIDLSKRERKKNVR